VLDYLLRELLSQQGAPVESLGDRGEHLVRAFGILLLLVASDGSPCGDPQRELPGGMEVQSASQCPRLNELATLPEDGSYVLVRDPLHPRRELELGGAHHLRVDAAHLADDFDQALSGSTFEQMAPCQASRSNVVPAQRAHGPA
jgi:hypothetical protein